MLVTNTTPHTYVLNTASPSVVVIIEADAVDQLVDNALYVYDSVFNGRFDQMVDGGILTVIGQPEDPSPSSGGGSAESPLVLTSHDADETPLTIQADTSQDANLVEIKDENGDLVFSIAAGGDVTSTLSIVAAYLSGAHVGKASLGANGGDGTIVPLVVQAEATQSANLIEAYDEDGNLMLNLDASHDLLMLSSEFITGTMQVLGVDTDQYAELQPGGFLARALADQSWSLLNLEVANGNTAFSVEPDGSTYIHARDATVIPLTVLAAAAQSADLLQVKDANNALVFSVRADGTVHAKTGGSIHFDL